MSMTLKVAYQQKFQFKILNKAFNKPSNRIFLNETANNYIFPNVSNWRRQQVQQQSENSEQLCR